MLNLEDWKHFHEVIAKGQGYKDILGNRDVKESVKRAGAVHATLPRGHRVHGCPPHDVAP